MRNFSEISDTLVTKHDSLMEALSVESGLPTDVVSKMYESYVGEDKINKFKELLKVNLTSLGRNFKNLFIKLLDYLKTNDGKISNKLVTEILDETAKTDSMAFLKLIIYLLFIKDEVSFKDIVNHSNINSKLHGLIERKTTSLYESLGINPDISDIDTKSLIIPGVNDGCDVQTNVEFYSDLKIILARNNRRWGYNYHLDNVYSTICDYIDSEISRLTTEANITTVDSQFQNTILTELLRGDLNPMYRDINTLRPLISDIQGLVFDMMVLVANYTKEHKDYLQFLNRKTLNDFDDCLRSLYNHISTSQYTSKLLKDKKNMVFDSIYCIDKKQYNIVWVDNKPIVDALYIIKSCSVDFNLSTRKYINSFLTKAFDVVFKLDKIIIESNKINKFKN